MLSEKTEQKNPIPVLPTSQTGPLIWISFFEENVKFGMAYMLNSNATGMRFNDSTTIVSNHQFANMKYIDFLAKGDE